MSPDSMACDRDKSIEKIDLVVCEREKNVERPEKVAYCIARENLESCIVLYDTINIIYIIVRMLNIVCRRESYAKNGRI